MIRMATTHGANTITRILPMAVEGVRVYNCSSGALLRTVVAGNFKLRQLYGPKDDDDDEDPNNHDEKKEEKEPVAAQTQDEMKENENENESTPATTTTTTTTTAITEAKTEKSIADLPPMAQKLAEISQYLYNEYNSTPVVNNALLNARPRTSASLLSSLNQQTNDNKTTTSTEQPDSTTKDESSNNETSNNEDDNKPILKLDVSKVAAAAGGGAYDEEADPLNAPEVLEAVAKFKKQLEERDTQLRKKRMDIVEQKLDNAMKRVRQKVKERKQKEKEEAEKAAAAAQAVAAQNPADPPLPPGSAPPPLPTIPGSEGAFAGVKESGKRMVSNLPSWMTQSGAVTNELSRTGVGIEQSTAEEESKKRKFTPSDANYDPSTRRKQRIDTDLSIAEIRKQNQAADAAADAAAASAIKEKSIPECKSIVRASKNLSQAFRDWITEKIVEYLGEEEVTLIDFIMQQGLGKDCDKQEMLEEMQQVLDEDADDFVKDLYQKIRELASL